MKDLFQSKSVWMVDDNVDGYNILPAVSLTCAIHWLFSPFVIIGSVASSGDTVTSSSCLGLPTPQQNLWSYCSGSATSITPTLATSKILVFVSVQVVGDSGVASAMWQLVRGSTAIAIGDAEGSRIRSTGVAYTGDTNTNFSGSINFLDSPSTTSATTYKCQVKIADVGTAYVNRSEGFGDNSGHSVNASTITVMEILA